MIKIFSTQYLATNTETNEVFVMHVRDVFFLGIRIKHEEHSDFDSTLIAKYQIPEQPKKVKPIGFKINTKTKKKKKDENKGKVS